jgi:hypothetical protein
VNKTIIKQQAEKEVLDHWCLENKVEVKEMKKFHYRLTKARKKIDIFPGGQRWHNLKDNSRGTYGELKAFLVEHFK